MRTPDTDARLASAYQALRAAQSRGEAPPPGQVSQRLYARMAGVSQATVRSVESMMLAKLHAGLSRHGISPADFETYLRQTIRPVDGHPTASADMRDSQQPSTGPLSLS